MSTAIEKMRAAMELADHFWGHVEDNPDRPTYYRSRATDAEWKMGQYALVAQAEAAERQAAAAEKQAEYLGRIMTAVEYMATGGVEDMPPALIAEVPPFWVDDDQRAEDDRNRNADIDADLRAADRAGGF